ncbi:MAG: HD-GYP domain-containing protein [Eubacteriales bacterium]
MVFRDVSDKKEQRNKIEYLSFHDSLTGLYNRRFFEEEMHRLDSERNYPISIIMGDVNGLKLTNDIFGHTYGDKLLETIAKIINKVCRPEDIISRWGGDEFVVLLPNTNSGDAEEIITRIKEEFAKEQIKSIRGSISLGTETKYNITQNIGYILNKAEEKMYVAKAIERDKFKNSVIESIIKTLHDNSQREKIHSNRVSELCVDMGKKLNLSDSDTKKLTIAGYYHDIGKIVLSTELLNKVHHLTEEEWNEIKKHPVIGYRILNSFDQTLDIAEIVLSHQERWDGTGYPKGLKGDEIPMISRIISIAESYERRFAEAVGDEQDKEKKATEELRKAAGTHFDPALTEIFIKMIENINFE